jgi:cyclic lactone autoinducer peptide
MIKEKRSDYAMKKLMNIVRGNFVPVRIMNLFAFAVALYSFNVTCMFAHHQPKVPEEAKMFRKF